MPFKNGMRLATDFAYGDRVAVTETGETGMVKSCGLERVLVWLDEARPEGRHITLLTTEVQDI